MTKHDLYCYCYLTFTCPSTPFYTITRDDMHTHVSVDQGTRAGGPLVLVMPAAVMAVAVYFR